MEEADLKVVDMIKTKCFMDDINIDAKYEENIKINIKKAEKILANGGFSFKKWIKSGDKGEKELAESETGLTGVNKSLGMSWKTEADKLVYRLKLNFSKKTRNRYVSPYTTKETLDDDFPEKMTKRLALKLNHSVFDPASLIQPWIFKLRLAFREILFYQKENDCTGWDNPLPLKFRLRWLQLTKEMFDLETLEFNRSIVPRNYDPNYKPTLCLFSDGSDLGQCACAYLVWKMKNGSFCVTLVTSRRKIASMTKITTHRSELNGGQLQTRLKTFLLQVLDIDIGEIYHIVDASIILGMIKSVSLKFDTYSAPRITEIQSNSDVNNWYWIQTKDTLQI